MRGRRHAGSDDTGPESNASGGTVSKRHYPNCTTSTIVEIARCSKMIALFSKNPKKPRRDHAGFGASVLPALCRESFLAQTRDIFMGALPNRRAYSRLNWEALT